MHFFDGSFAKFRISCVNMLISWGRNMQTFHHCPGNSWLNGLFIFPNSSIIIIIRHMFLLSPIYLFIYFYHYTRLLSSPPGWSSKPSLRSELRFGPHQVSKMVMKTICVVLITGERLRGFFFPVGQEWA